MPGGGQGPGLRKPAAQERKGDLLCTNNPHVDRCKLWDKDRVYFSRVPGMKQSLRTGLQSRKSCIISRGQGMTGPSMGRHVWTTEERQLCCRPQRLGRGLPSTPCQRLGQGNAPHTNGDTCCLHQPSVLPFSEQQHSAVLGELPLFKLQQGHRPSQSASMI